MMTDEQIREAAASVMDRAKRATGAGLKAPSMILVVCTRNPLTGEPIDDACAIVPITVGGSDTRGDRDRMLWEARFVAVAGAAHAAIVVGSTIAACVPIDEFNSNQQRVLDDERRREVILVGVEWSDATRPCEASIARVTRDQGFIDFDDLPPGTPVADQGGFLGAVLLSAGDYANVEPRVLAKCRLAAAQVIDRASQLLAVAHQPTREVARG